VLLFPFSPATQTASALNSRDTFILNTPQSQYVWFGKGVEASHRPHIVTVASSLRAQGVPVAMLNEGQESPDFWRHLSGQKEYPNGLCQLGHSLIPRLFDCSFASGAFAGEEVTAFCQEDLTPDHAYILDVVAEVYVWIGPLCSEALASFSMKVAMDYHRTHTDGRPKNTNAVFRVRSDQEPLSFTCHFLGWNGLLKTSKRKRSTLQRVMKIEEPRLGSGGGGKESYVSTGPPLDADRVLKRARSTEAFGGAPIPQAATAIPVLPVSAPVTQRPTPVPAVVATAPQMLTRRQQQLQQQDPRGPKLVHLTLSRPKPSPRRKPTTKDLRGAAASHQDLMEFLGNDDPDDDDERSPLPVLAAAISTRPPSPPEPSTARLLPVPVPRRPETRKAPEVQQVIPKPRPRSFKATKPDDERLMPVTPAAVSSKDIEDLRFQLAAVKTQLVQTTDRQQALETENAQLQKLRVPPVAARPPGPSTAHLEQEVARLRQQNREMSTQLDVAQRKADESTKVVAQHVQCRPQMQELKKGHELEKRQLLDLHAKERQALRQENEGEDVVPLCVCASDLGNSGLITENYPPIRVDLVETES